MVAVVAVVRVVAVVSVVAVVRVVSVVAVVNVVAVVEDSVKSDPKFVACVDGRRRSRCPCLKANQGCKIACKCKNCGNPNT